ncbi:MAG TPA: PLP-dependent aspartate aminotransferase family protein [Gammaproteobacteria bacterium]
MKRDTRVNHPREVTLPEGNRPLVPPVHRSVKFTFPTIEDSLRPEARVSGFEYTRDSNPTIRELELVCAELQGRDDGIAVATGMAAVWLALLGTLEAGARIVIFVESYRPTRVAVRRFLPRFGVEFSMLSIHDLDGIERELARPETKVVLFESPTNPLLHVADIGAIVDIAKRHDVTTILDNTFAGLHNHGQFAVDYYLHSLTKYANGHGDAMGGIVIADSARIKALRPQAVNLGATMDPGAAWLMLRGLKTYTLRYARHSENALAIAKYLATRPEVERVHYPGLPEHPGHALAKRQMEDFGGVLCFDLRSDEAGAWRFIDALELFATTASLGSTDSLVAPAKLYGAGDLGADELAMSGVKPSTVRLAVGIEHVDDLIADLARAFDKWNDGR